MTARTRCACLDTGWLLESAQPPVRVTRLGYRAEASASRCHHREIHLAPSQPPERESTTVTLPDKTDPSRRKKRPPAPRVEVPAPRDTWVDEDVVDAPLHRTEPDTKLQHRTLHWVGVSYLAALASVCVVAITSGSVPIPLAAPMAILAATIPIIVRYAFPSGRR